MKLYRRLNSASHGLAFALLSPSPRPSPAGRGSLAKPGVGTAVPSRPQTSFPEKVAEGRMFFCNADSLIAGLIFMAVLLAGCGSSQGLSLVRDAENGNIEAVRQHLAKGADVNATNQLGETALHKSSAKGYGEVVGLLIANGAKVNVKNRNGWTPLHHVTWGGFGDIAELFVAKGADVNAKTKFGGTPLLNAVHKGHKEIAVLLIAEGANVNVIVNGATPLDLAIENSHAEIADLLNKHGGKTAGELE